MSVLTVNKLFKNYGDLCVLNDVSFDVQPGRLVGFLGPNGAGKTTTIRILLGLLKMTSGSASMLNLNCQSQGPAVRAQVGYIPGDVHLYSNLTGRKTLNFLQRARGLNCKNEVDRLAERFDLQLDRVVRKYSTGMRQKLALIQALMHRPKLLVLDEPTSALDPLVKTVVFDELKEVVNRGQSVLFSSHSLNEVEELCDDVIILRRGKIVENQSLETLKKRALKRIQITFSSEETIPADLPTHFQLTDREGLVFGGTWNTEVTELIDWLRDLQIDDLIVERPDLNDLFLTYYANGNPNR